MKTFDLMFGNLGNGTTVCDRSQTDNGDYKTVAHIAEWGGVKIYDAQLRTDRAALERIEAHAAAQRDRFRLWWMQQRYIRQYGMWYDSLTITQVTELRDSSHRDQPAEWYYSQYIDNVNRRHGYKMPTA